MTSGVADVLTGSYPWAVVQSDCLAFLASLPPNSVDLVCGSPPYENCRTYGIDFAISGQAWVDWMVTVCESCLRVCHGLVVFVVQGKTESYRWSATPALLMADLHRKGIHLRSPMIYRRVGMPGSGGSDYMRSDYEWILTFTRGGKLPWADPKAMGHPPKYGPGGEMSHRTANGSRVNQWGMSVKKSGGFTGGEMRKPDGARPARPRCPSHVVAETVTEPGLFGPVAVPPPEDGSRPVTLRNANGVRDDGTYRPPAIANPGNCVQHTYTAQEVADILGEPSDVVDCTAGGGQMGSKLCHENEAPFPERLPEFFIRSFCAPGSVCLDPFAGSGTTGAVAVRWGRRFLGCDVRSSQVALARQRIAGETPSLFEGAGTDR